MFNFVELFAGCGGTSLGLKAAGFDLLFANELSPMAGETFSYNILGEDLEELSRKEEFPESTLWLSSQFPAKDLAKRLKENPNLARAGQYCDLKQNVDIHNKLIIGDISELIKKLRRFKFRNVDVLSGGPPCQAFSLAGRRDKNDNRNNLPLHFAEIAGMLNPRIIILENVVGILSPFIDDNGNEFYTWFEVAKVFALKGFVPICLIVNTKQLGIPQNRSRFIMIAFRHNELNKYYKKGTLCKATKEIIKNSCDFYDVVQKSSKEHESLRMLDPKILAVYNNEQDDKYWECELFPYVFSEKDQKVTVKEAIDDLKNKTGEFQLNNWDDLNGYPRSLLYAFKAVKSPSQFWVKNHHFRKHSNIIKSRYKLLQVIEKGQTDVKKSYFRMVRKYLKTRDLNSKVIEFLAKKKLFFLNEDGKGNYKIEYRVANNNEDLLTLIDKLRTKKTAQNALNANQPAPAQLTIPDDFCHYDRNSQRTLTVREMSRIQTFPDWFVFKSNITTGSYMRKYEVPQYSQVGNAVPPLLAKLIGEKIVYYLKSLDGQ